jgi:hypothetical protein
VTSIASVTISISITIVCLWRIIETYPKYGGDITMKTEQFLGVICEKINLEKVDLIFPKWSFWCLFISFKKYIPR